MGGIFGVISEKDCVEDLFYGTDYHSHLGTEFGGLAVKNAKDIKNKIHRIKNSPFRSKFNDDLKELHGNSGIGVISDYEVQPLLIRSHLGNYAVATVGRINNQDELVKKILTERKHLIEMSKGEVNPTELVATLIAEKDSFEDGIAHAQELINGSCTIILLTDNGIYAARDKAGRTPLIIGNKEGSYAVASETCSFHNCGFKIERDLGAGEIVFINKDGVQQKKKPNSRKKICSFLWIYYGNPSSTYEGINVEEARHRCGAALAKRDNIQVDVVAGIPDSGTAHAIGYANAKGVHFGRPAIKYVDTWQRSFMPQEQADRDVVAKMKLIYRKEQIDGKKILFCDDSIVRGTQLKDNVKRIFDCGAKEVHVRPACPPLCFGCKFLNFSRSKDEFDLAARTAIRELEGKQIVTKEELDEYSNPDSEKYKKMVEKIKESLGVTTLQYQRLKDMIEAIGLPEEELCTYCWTGKE